MRVLPLSAAYDQEEPTFKTGELNGLTASHIRAILSMFSHRLVGLAADGKVTQQWIFEVGGPSSFTGYKLAIWDYKGSGLHKRWSTYGPHCYFEVFFGENYTRFADHKFPLLVSPLN